ncbi:MAG TPA: prolyl oligopeptidase family serine peptidase, partial [Roseimicrobium sp.]|nr:prolyl oligopeptidase family serine peptidase [Roseimicrobium sp.]
MKRTFSLPLVAGLAGLFFTQSLPAAPAALPVTPGDRMVAEYFRQETDKLADRSLADIRTLEDWKSKREEYRRQLFEMLGMSPMPEKTDLKPVVTGRVEHELFSVENLHYQSRPGLYVTANLYVPKGGKVPFPAILYVCGHGQVKSNGVSFGNKTSYQHHGEWFARNGYVCLTIDTIQLGELEGVHHGTHRDGMWWWNARGYTPAGVEAWNSIRGLDYLQSRPEVDGNRLGVTGRSGGGAYTWWTVALDERVKVAVPVAGITDLHNHVVDGVIEGHCDCMFQVNTYRWDYAQVAALVAPRPLLISNSDKDTIFPLDGVGRVHEKVRRIYELYGASTNLGLLITEGPHKDTQDLQVPAFRWFNRFLKKEEPLIEMAAVKMFEPKQLKVFKEFPKDQITTTIHETFVPQALESVPKDKAGWSLQRDAWMKALATKSFAGWPAEGAPLDVKKVFSAKADGFELTAYDFTSQGPVVLRLYSLQKAGSKAGGVTTLNVLDDAGWSRWLSGAHVNFATALREELAVATLVMDKAALTADANVWTELASSVPTQGTLVWLAPRSVGPTATHPDPRKVVQVRRRYQLLGQTLDGMRVWDIRRAAQAMRSIQGTAPLKLAGQGSMAVNVLYASLFEPPVASLELRELPASHRTGPDYLNVMRFL